MKRTTSKPKISRPKTSKPKATVANPVTMDPDGMWQLIAQKAYDLYEQRGRREGRALDDWLEAEQIVMDELHEARE